MFEIATAITLLVAGTRAAATPLKFPVVDLGYEIHRAAAYNATNTYYTFQNVPFAKPPVGSLRWEPPQRPAVNRSAINDGSSVVGVCPGTLPGWFEENLFGASGMNNAPPGYQSEDCLYVDVYAPHKTLAKAEAGSKAPVLVWIHGGANTIGDKSPQANGNGFEGLLYEAQEMAEAQGLVFVSVNYRLGAFGWLGGPRFQHEHGAVNAGLLDVRAALDWVQEYICKFGGDPRQVTIMGESGGAGIVLYQITANGGKGQMPFRQAIMQSPVIAPPPSGALKDAEYETFLHAANASSLSELRGLDTNTLINASINIVQNAPYPILPFSAAAIDGTFVQNSPSQLLQEGKFDKDVNIMIGINSNEGGVFVLPDIAATPNYSFSSLARSWLPRAPAIDVAEIEALYPPAGSNTPYVDEQGRASRFVGDILVYNHELIVSKTFWNTTHVYEFSVPSGDHLQDVSFTFANGLSNETFGDGLTATVDTPQKLHVATSLQQYVVDFAATGKPAPRGLPQIPVYGHAKVLNLTLDGFHIVQDPASTAQNAYLNSRKYL